MECTYTCSEGASQLLSRQIITGSWVKHSSLFPHIPVLAARVNRNLLFLEYQQKPNRLQRQKAAWMQQQQQQRRVHPEQQQEHLKQLLVEGKQQDASGVEQSKKNLLQYIRVKYVFSHMKRHICTMPSKLQQQMWQEPLSKRVLVQMSGRGALVEGCRRSYSSTAATKRMKKKKRSNNRQREGGKKKLIEKERVIKNPFKYENKRDGIELVKRGKIFSPEEVKDGYHLAVLLVTLQKFGFAEDKTLLFRYAERAYALSPLLYPKPAALILNVLARNELVHIPLLQSLSSRLVPRLLRHANAQDLALLLHAFAAFKWPDPAFFVAAAEEIPHKLPFFEPQHLVATAQAINKLHSYNSHSNSSITEGHNVIKSCKGGGGIGGTDRVVAAFDQHALLLDDIAEETLRKLPRFNAKATALIAAALGSAAAATQRQRDLVSLSERPTSTYPLSNATSSLAFSAGKDSNTSLRSPASASAAVASLIQTATDAPPPAASATAAASTAAAAPAGSPDRTATARALKTCAVAEADCDVQSVATAPTAFSASVDDTACSPAAAPVVDTAAANSPTSFFMSPAGGDGCGGCMRPLFWNRLLDHAYTLREEMDAAELIKVFSGAANAKAEQHEALASYASNRILQVFNELPLALLSQLFNACAKWGYYDKRLFAAVTRRVAATAVAEDTRRTARIATRTKYETPDVACIGQLLHACGCLRHRDPLLVELLAYRLYHHAIDAAAAAQAASSVIAVARSASPAPDSAAAVAAASLVPTGADRSASWQLAPDQQQQNCHTAYVHKTFLKGQKLQHRLTPQTLAVSLRALYRLRWGQRDECSSRDAPISRNNRVVGSSSNSIDDIGEDIFDNKIWMKELVPLLAHLVLQQLHHFTPQGLCECTDALSGLLFRNDGRHQGQHAQRQQLRRRQQHEIGQQEPQLPEPEQQLKVESGEKVEFAVETDMLQCDENILFYRLAEQLTSMWPLLSLQGVVTIIRAFGRRGKNGDIPLFHRCIDRVRHALRSMSFGECLIAKQAVAASLAHAVKGTLLLPPPSRHLQKQGEVDVQEQMEKGAETERQGGEECLQDDFQQGQRNMLQSHRGEKHIPGRIAAVDVRVLSSDTIDSSLALLNQLNNLSAAEDTTHRRRKSVPKRASKADTLRRIASLALAIDRRLHCLSTSAGTAQASLLNTTARMRNPNASAIGNAGDTSTATSSVAAVAENVTSVASHRPASLLLRNECGFDAAAAAVAAAKEEELAQLLFDNSAGLTSANADLGSNNDSLCTLPEDIQNLTPRSEEEYDVQMLEKKKEKDSSYMRPAQGWREQAKRYDGVQEQLQPEEKEERLQRNREQQQYRQRHHPLEQWIEDKSSTHAPKTAAPAVGLPCRSAAPQVFGDSLDALIASQRGAASGYVHSSDSSSRERCTSTNRISSVRNGNNSNDRDWSMERANCSTSSTSSHADSSSRSTRRCSTRSTEGYIGRRRSNDKHGRGRLQEQQAAFPVEKVQQDTHWLSAESAKQQRATTPNTGRQWMQRPLPHKDKTGTERIHEEANVDKDDEEEPRPSLRELLRASAKTVQQPESNSDRLCRGTPFTEDVQQQASAAVNVRKGHVVKASTVGEGVRPLKPQDAHYPRGDQQFQRQNWHEEGCGQPYDLEHVVVNTQQLQHPVDGELEHVHVTRGRRRRQCTPLLLEEREQQASTHYRESVLPGGEKTNAAVEQKNFPLSLSLGAPVTSSAGRLAGGRVAQWQQGRRAAPNAAVITHGAESPCTAEEEITNQGRSSEETRMTSLIAVEACMPGKDSSRVDGTGLIVRNKELRERAAAAGGYETGYVDLTNLLGTPNPSAVLRPENRHPGSLKGVASQSGACRDNKCSSHVDSGRNLRSSTGFPANDSHSSRTGCGSYVMQASTGSGVSSDIPLFSAATGGRKSKRLHRK